MGWLRLATEETLDMLLIKLIHYCVWTSRTISNATLCYRLKMTGL
jgi:hypothetical protein